MRKIALKGFAALLVTLMVCFFFAGTIASLTTPKVMIAYPKQGRLKEQVTLRGYLVFSDTADVAAPELPEGISLEITGVLAVPGMYVQAGDVLFEARAVGADAQIAALQQRHAEARMALLALEKSNSALRLHRNDHAWLAALNALALAYDAQLSARVALEVATRLRQIALTDGQLPEGISDAALLEAQAACALADRHIDTALTDMEKASRAGISDVAYNYLMERRALEAVIAQSAEDIIALRTLCESVRQIRAAHAGYVLRADARAGQLWDGLAAAVTLSAQGARALLRADASAAARAVAAGAVVNIVGRSGAQVQSAVTDVGHDALGNPFVDVLVPQDAIPLLDTPARLMNQGVDMRMDYIASAVESLLPVSAIRGAGDNRFVYVINRAENAFGQLTLRLEKLSVTVLDEAGDMAAISGLPYGTGVAHREDRAVAPGAQVMEYE